MVEGEDVPIEEITGSVVWNESRVVAGMVSVRPGAKLTISKGVVIEFDNQSGIDVLGTLNIDGTPEQPVILKKKDSDVGDFYAIKSISNGRTVARNVDISGGGSAYEAFLMARPSLVNRAYGYWYYVGALGAYSGGTLDIEGVSFHENALAVYTDTRSYFNTKVWRSKFSQNNSDIVNESSQGKVDVRYNWWGETTGPSLCVTECIDRRRTYEKMIGGVNFVDWATTVHFKDPVVVIPGIMGSWRMTQRSELELDPVFGTYDELVETLDENGYTRDQDLFLFPYEWRMSNVETAKSLKSQIDQIKTQTKWPRVDIVAHSMGGLVTREYIGALNGGGSIDQLITLGTPHNGSPKSYLTWDGGQFSSASRFSLADFFTKKIFEQEAEENEYESVFNYVRGVPIASVRELLPVSSYLREKDTGEMRVYPELYPRNAFIEKLKTSVYLNKLNSVLFSNIVGKTEHDETISTLRVDGASIELLNNPENIVLWGYGKPDGFDDFTGDRGMELGSGDGVVPLDSVLGVASDEAIELESNHGNLPAIGAKKVVKILTGHDAIASGALMYPAQSIIIFMPFSPVDIQIVSPSGQKSGKNFETNGYYDEIPGAYYTGYDTKNEFITIPNPEKGEYRVLIQGIGAGVYRVKAVHIAENADGQAEESIAVIAGVAELGLETESTIELKETGEVTVGGQDVTPPITVETLSGASGVNDWYTSDVTVTLTATDNEGGSGVKQTEYSLDNGATWNVFTEPLVVTTEGTTTLQYFSTDKAHNKEMVQTQIIQIDKTAPEGKVVFDLVTHKIVVTGTDNLGGSVPIVMFEQPQGMLATLTDEANNTTTIGFGKYNEAGKQIKFEMQSLAYGTMEVTLSPAFLNYEWALEKNGDLKMLNEKAVVGVVTVQAHYNAKDGMTRIERTEEGLTTSEEVSGLTVLKIVTIDGKVVIQY